MVKCPKCGSKNDNINEFCLECGNNLKSLETTKFNIKAILLGIITLFFLLIIRTLIHFDTLFLYTISMMFIFFVSGVITGYTANKLYISSAILNGLIVGIIFSIIGLIILQIIYPILYGYTYLIFLLLAVVCGIGGGLGGYIKFKEKIS